LESARTAREATRDRLTTASLTRLTAPDTDAETFRSHARFTLDALPTLTTRPDQIKTLRQTILNLALRGKLVEQDRADEPAGVLLERVGKIRMKLLRSDYPNASEARTQLKKLSQQTLPKDLPSLPASWIWATLQQCSLLVVDCKNKTAPYSESGIKLVRTTNVRDGKLNLIDQKYVTDETYAIWSARCVPQSGDILITREAPMGEVCLIPPDEKICLGQRMMLARLVPETIDPDFLLYSLRDPKLMDRVQDKPLGMTVQHLRVGGIETLLVPLPPLAEQHRIVAKVNELMALCDQLEASLTTADTTRRRLLEALLHEALEPAADALEAAE
jgi:type I restriction enzyme S subunit